MSDNLFSAESNTRLGGRARRALMLPLSVTAHGVVLVLLVILPLLGVELPSIAEPLAAWVTPVALPEPPAARSAQAAATRRAAELAARETPVVPPSRIGNEIGIVVDPAFDLKSAATGETGLPSGVVDGVTIDAAPPAPAAAPPARPLPIGGDIRPPRRIGGAMPDYPVTARQARVEGIVIIEAVIDVSGRVTGTRLLRGHPLLEQAALDAVRQWVYEPTRLNGQPVAVVMTVTVNFTLRVP